MSPCGEGLLFVDSILSIKLIPDLFIYFEVVVISKLMTTHTLQIVSRVLKFNAGNSILIAEFWLR
jgi:hypothetical protein